jgi:flavin reductase (DIM6/NTAB) family NADH-FMN oxidoreductase RutF
MANTTSPTLDAPAEPSQTSTVDQHDNALPHTVTAQLSSTPSPSINWFVMRNTGSWNFTQSGNAAG